jgi:hypothetical protein
MNGIGGKAIFDLIAHALKNTVLPSRAQKNVGDGFKPCPTQTI